MPQRNNVTFQMQALTIIHDVYSAPGPDALLIIIVVNNSVSGLE